VKCSACQSDFAMLLVNYSVVRENAIVSSSESGILEC
jgi:hypothetical protein